MNIYVEGLISYTARLQSFFFFFFCFSRDVSQTLLMNTFLKSSAGGKLNLTLEVPDDIRFFHGKNFKASGSVRAAVWQQITQAAEAVHL